MRESICKTCKKDFLYRPSDGKKGMFCSRDCYKIHQKVLGKDNKGVFQTGKSIWNGRRHTEESKKKMSEARIGRFGMENHPAWAGNKVKYRALHTWVEKMLGKPDKCEDCGKKNLSGRAIHWANKSRLYQRVTTDWIRLCVKCHGIYDTGHHRNQSALSFH